MTNPGNPFSLRLEMKCIFDCTRVTSYGRQRAGFVVKQPACHFRNSSEESHEKRTDLGLLSPSMESIEEYM
jgi:hypothetical protein